MVLRISFEHAEESNLSYVTYVAIEASCVTKSFTSLDALQHCLIYLTCGISKNAIKELLAIIIHCGCHANAGQ